MITADICALLKIGRTNFDKYRPELMRFGLFQINGPGSEYRMRQADFIRYVENLAKT